MFLQMLNIEWGQIDPKDNRRVNVFFSFPGNVNLFYIYNVTNVSNCMLLIVNVGLINDN